mmetsp:Transcript_80422/g.167504  ORF Transcript_80422/g.167504 Transcript_80422/m.167504 type:complete len:206 (+) Transcript_80422:790-1407(+)
MGRLHAGLDAAPKLGGQAGGFIAVQVSDGVLHRAAAGRLERSLENVAAELFVSAGFGGSCGSAGCLHTGSSVGAPSRAAARVDLAHITRATGHSQWHNRSVRADRAATAATVGIEMSSGWSHRVLAALVVLGCFAGHLLLIVVAGTLGCLVMHVASLRGMGLLLMLLLLLLCIGGDGGRVDVLRDPGLREAFRLGGRGHAATAHA